MSEENAFTRILNRLNAADSDSVTEKTAAVVAPQTKSAEAELLATVRAVSNAVTKTASVSPGRPAASLEKMAKQAFDSENELMSKQAHHMGAALADGFMERFAQYDTALSAQGVKTASADPMLLQKTAEAAYVQAVQDMEKHAAEEYQRGYNDQLEAIHKTASEIHYAGQVVANNIVETLRTSK